MFHAILPSSAQEDDGEFACGQRYPGNRRRLRPAGRPSTLDESDRYCDKCVEELARHRTMAQIDAIAWFDSNGRWGLCKHYHLPGYFEALEAIDRPPSPTRRAPHRRTQGRPLVGSVHAFLIAAADEAFVRRIGLLSPMSAIASAGVGGCGFVLETYVADDVPLWSKPPSTDLATCRSCLDRALSLANSGAIRETDLQWRDEGGVLRGVPASVVAHTRSDAPTGPVASARRVDADAVRQGAALIAMEKSMRADD